MALFKESVTTELIAKDLRLPTDKIHKIINKLSVKYFQYGFGF
jgi:hypothetical protein